MPTNFSPVTQPLLTIAIPTYNRSSYLAENLTQIRSELRGIQANLVEIVVSDNCSTDGTPVVVEQAIASNLPVRYFRNATNVGWARNFAQAFDVATGKYILLLGDDDLFIDGSLALLLSHLATGRYGVVCLRPYGYDDNWRREYPGGKGKERIFRDASEFIVAISRFMTLTSACVCNKSLLVGIDSKKYVTGDLAAFQFVLRAALAADENLFLDQYLVASKRQNSAAYEFAGIFVTELWRIIDDHMAFGLSRSAVRRIERDKLFSYYPFYVFDLRVSCARDLETTYNLFEARFGGRWLFDYWVGPTLRLPRPVAVAWGGATTLVGRVCNGELRRGVKFAWVRISRALTRQRMHPVS